MDLETEAARKNSPADTRIDVLHADGSPVVRCLLRAVRDSAVTFRPIDSRQGGVRLENWQEMDLDQFLYMSGEVCRLFRRRAVPIRNTTCIRKTVRGGVTSTRVP